VSDDTLWYRDAIVYQLHIKAFFDSTDDGIGDFAGLAEKLDYIQDLGVTAVWLLPFYPSPLRDDGYDIADYRNVNPAYGALRDFRRFVHEAHRRGIRVITELVINHTSDQHPWFQRARRAKPGSAWRDWYVWSDTDTKYSGTRIIFTDTETSNWAWDPVANAYYWHRFFSHQPDLNFDNPQVLKAVLRAMDFWLDMGVDGLRLDAVPYLCEREGTNNENLPESHEVIRKIRASIDARYDDRMLLGEANQWPEDVRPYFGDGDECHMAFHFPLMPRIYMAVAQEDRHPITDIMRQTPDIPDGCQWAVFLRNHDELTLEMVTNRERDYLWSFYAADPRMRINVGIRRRLAPLLENDRRKIELLNALLMSMPGTPITYYGDEIGMGDNIFLGDRDAVRTPMQWSPDRNAGFSKADPARMYLPPIMDPVYGFEAVNVEAQNRSPSSLLSWMKRLIAARKAHVSFGRGTISFLFPGNRKVLAYLREFDDESILCVANLSRAPQPVELELSAYKGRTPVELLGQSPFPPIGDLPYFITLPGYGFYWFMLASEVQAPSWHETYAAPPPELYTLVIPRDWESLAEDPARTQIETRLLPDFLPNQRWFAAKGIEVRAVTLTAMLPISSDRGRWLLAIYRVALADGSEQNYLTPLAMGWESEGDDPLVRLLPFTLARVRKGATLGILYDSVADDKFAQAIVDLIANAQTPAEKEGAKISFIKTNAFVPPDALDELAVERVGADQSNSSILIGEDMILKLYRKLETGVHPEIEMGCYLTDVGHYGAAPPLLGAIEYVDAENQRTAIGVLHARVQNQGDGWGFTLDYLGRFLEDADLLAAEAAEAYIDRHDAFAERMRHLGARTAELHQVLCRDTTDAAFRPEPVKSGDLAAWRRQVRAQARSAFAALRRSRGSLSGETAAMAETVLARRSILLSLVDSVAPKRVEAVKARLHGDLHLGQVLVDQDDFIIIDFEGEPARPIEERRSKHSPLKDVAGMLRSIDYAAWTAVLERASVRPEMLESLLPWAMDWEARATQGFVAGYHDAIAGCTAYPKDEAQAAALIKLFTLEKAFYEICYEAVNRPGWLRIPLQGILRILEENEAEGA
jgi:maltose alpha-D-glucosyltransferase/alpha-amylase